MFKELAPVLRHRAVLMTITSIEDDQIRVNVVPKKLKDDENKALTTPLTITGTAEDLDAELGSTLVDFVASHLQLKNTLKQAKADMEEAAKAAQAEARAKSKTPVKKDAPASTSPSKPSQPAKTPTEPVQPPPPKTASLFDMPAPAATIGFNGHFIVEFLKTIGAEGEVRLSLKDSASAAVITPEAFNPEYQQKYVVMPMRI